MERKKYKWIPDLAEKINLEPFSLHIITGPRQAGKTTLVKLMIKRLLEQGREEKSIFYFNCENVADFRELSEILNSFLGFKESSDIKNSIEIDFITKDSLIEAKYNQEINEKQLEVFNSIKSKNKTVAKGYEFFLS